MTAKRVDTDVMAFYILQNVTCTVSSDLWVMSLVIEQEGVCIGFHQSGGSVVVLGQCRKDRKWETVCGISASVSVAILSVAVCVMAAALREYPPLRFDRDGGCLPSRSVVIALSHG
jgi:hypothetical protein